MALVLGTLVIYALMLETAVHNGTYWQPGDIPEGGSSEPTPPRVAQFLKATALPTCICGNGVNIAARFEGVAKPGTICLSEQAYWQVKARLDLAVSDLGNQSLKNIAEPVRVYSLEVGKPAQAKPTKPAPPSSVRCSCCWPRGSSHSS